MIKYQGTLNFIVGLFFEETEEKHYFGFMPTEIPSITINNEGDYAIAFSGRALFFVDKYQTIFEAKGKTFGKNGKMFSLILIDPDEFDSLYKLLECIYE